MAPDQGCTVGDSGHVRWYDMVWFYTRDCSIRVEVPRRLWSGERVRMLWYGGGWTRDEGAWEEGKYGGDVGDAYELTSVGK